MQSSVLETVLPICQTAKVRGVILGTSLALSSTPFHRLLGACSPDKDDFAFWPLCLGTGIWEGRNRRENGARGPVQMEPLCPCWSPGDQSEHRQALKNIASMVRSGGLLVIDHRNYDHILSTGCAPPGKNIYYKVWSTREGQAPNGRCEPGVLWLHSGLM